MNTKRGFTLVELLVAATIIAGLAVFATISYRNSAAESRWTAAQARVQQLANAVQRLQTDYPQVESFKGSVLEDLTSTELANMSCPLKPGIVSTRLNPQVTPKALIACGYIENGGWTNDYWMYQVKWSNNLSSASSCRGGLACVQALSNAKIPEKYSNLLYYVKADGTSETYIN